MFDYNPIDLFFCWKTMIIILWTYDAMTRQCTLTVLNVRFDTDASRIIFGLEESNIRQEFRSITIEFETSSNRHYIHQHDRLFRRASGDLATSDISPLSAADVLRAASSSTQGNNQTNVKDLGFKSNATFFDPIDLGCTDCVGKGQMVTTVGDLKFELFPDNDDDPIKTGFIQLEIKGFEMSLGLHVTPSAEFLRYKKNIYRVPTPLKLGVPKIFSLGIEILLEAFIETKTNSTAEIQFGFDVKIPDSGVLLNVAEFQDSQIWGFDKTKITPKLLAANTSDLTFNLKGGLRPKIVAKLDLIGVAKVEGGPYFTLPEITLNAKQLGSDKVGANCEAGGATHEKFKDAFKNLTQVEYGVALAAGFGLGLDVLGLSVMSKSKDVWKPGDLATKTTQCLAYEKTGTASGFALATSVLQKMTSTPTPTVTATKGTSSGYQLWDFRGSPLIVLVWASSVIIPVLL
ncbi:hypothetical protein B0J11DRAFT_616386 [Dendryphion nanum]|uniref:Uncharacterized protein n=1 Tax=Dendryphion nanum TaxID=256645 RepID=A0A9P9DLA0_9PLEO|nr:hypothetical protein B0J11DRAFT_616386 [Dendryphion nanum]